MNQKHFTPPSKEDQKENVIFELWTIFLFAIPFFIFGAIVKAQATPLTSEFVKELQKRINYTFTLETTLRSRPELFIQKFDVIQAVNFIAAHESFRAYCYEDGGGLSHGFGHRCLGGKITRKDSLKNLEQGVSRINSQITGIWYSNQRTGLISFLYNHQVNQSKYVKMINSDLSKFKKDLEYKANNYIWINGIRQGGLTKRRKAEYNLIF